MTHYTVYLLYSKAYKKTYVGFTSNFEARIRSHNELGHKGWTRKFRPWDVVQTEIFATKSEAMAREKYLKSGIGREEVKARIASWLDGQ